MNEEAIKLIQTTAVRAASQLQGVAPAATIVLPDDHKVFDLQRYEPLKRRFTGTLNTSDLSDFIGYTTAHSDPTAEGFIDADRLSCTVFFNLGDQHTPGHGDWNAQLTLKKTAAYTAMLHRNGFQFEQRELTDWLEDWGDFITPQGADEGTYYGSVGKAIQAIRKITIKSNSEKESSVGDFAASRTAMEQIEASSKLELPAAFTFHCDPYLGLPWRSFKLRLQVLTGSDVPVLVLRIVQLEAQQEAIAKDFKEVLQAGLADQAILTIGTFSA